MAFTWGKEEAKLPEKLKGKTPEQVEADLVALQTERDALKARETELAGQVNQATATLQTQQSELNQVKQNLAQLQQKSSNPPNPNTPTAPTSVIVDEDTAFAERLAPVTAATMSNAARLARIVAEGRMSAKGRDKFLLGKYRNEYDALVATLSPAQLTMEDAYENCFRIVKANHIDDMLAGGDRFFVESGGAPPPEDAPKPEVLTDAEKAAARRFGVTEAQYLASKKEMTAA